MRRLGSVLFEMNVFVLLFAVSCVPRQCGAVSKTLVECSKIRAEHKTMEKSSMSTYGNLIRTSQSTENAELRAAIKESLSNLTSNLLNHDLKLRTPADITEAEWDEMKTRFDILRNSTLENLLSRSTETSEKHQISQTFEEVERQLLPGGDCETISRAISGNRKVNETVGKSVCDNVKSVLAEIPSIPTPARVWFAKWHQLMKLMLASARVRDISPDIRLLLKIQRFQLKRLIAARKEPSLDTLEFETLVCEISVNSGLESVDIHPVLDGFIIYQQEGILLGPKNDWNSSNFMAHNDSRHRSFEGLRMLLTNPSTSNADKLKQVFSELHLRTAVAAFEQKKRFIDHLLLDGRAKPECKQRVSEILRDRASIHGLICSYVGMSDDDLVRMSLLAQRTTQQGSNTTGKIAENDHQCFLRQIFRKLQITERLQRVIYCFQRDTFKTVRQPKVFRDCGIEPNGGIQQALIESQKNFQKNCKRILWIEQNVLSEETFNNLQSWIDGIADRVQDRMSSVLAAEHSDIERVKCFYQELNTGFIQRHRQLLLGWIQTDEADFIEIFKTDVRQVAELEKLPANETELIVGFVNESLSDPPQRFPFQQTPTLLEIWTAFTKSLKFLRAFLDRCSADVAHRGKSIKKHIDEIYKRKIVNPKDFLCEDSLSLLEVHAIAGA